MSIAFTQYLMPNGRQEQVTIRRSVEIEEMAAAVRRKGFCFEIEMLSDYKTISMEVINAKEQVIAGRLCHNGPTEGDKLGVPESVDKMIREAFAILYPEPKQ